MANKAIINDALVKFNSYESRIMESYEEDPGIVDRQSTPRLKKLFEQEFRDKVKLEIRGIATWDKDAHYISNEMIAQAVHS